MLEGERTREQLHCFGCLPVEGVEERCKKERKISNRASYLTLSLSHLRQAGGCSWQVQSTEGGSTLLGLQFYGAPLLRCNLALIRSEVASKHGSEGSHFVGGGGCGKA